MKRNVFLKSVLRRPIRALILALLIGVAAFAFVLRTVEYAVVHNQIQQIGGFFQTVGVLRPVDGNIAMDVSEAAELIGGSPLVSFEDRRRGFEGVLAEGQNPIFAGEHLWAFWAYTWTGELSEFDPAWLFETDYELLATFTPYLNYLAYEYHGFARPMSGDAFFYAKLLEINYVHERPSDWGMFDDTFFAPHINMLVQVKSSYAGYEDHVGDGAYVVLRYYLAEDEAAEDGSHPFENLIIGEDYFFKATHYYFMGNFQSNPTKPEIAANIPNLRNVLFVKPLNDGGLWYLPAGQAASDMIEDIEKGIMLTNHAQSSLHIRTTADMTAMDMTAAGNITARTGRLPDREDYLEVRPVVAIHRLFAERRGLSVGDTITVNINREQHLLVPDYYWHRTMAGSVVGIYSDLGIFSKPCEPVAYELELEIIGIYEKYPSSFGGFETISKFIYIPDSVLPDDLRILSAPWGELSADYTPAVWYSFLLNDSRDMAAFNARYGAALEEMGFIAEFLGRDSTNFWVSANMALQSITINLALFSFVLVLVIVLTVFILLHQRRKDFAVQLALGVPPKTVKRQVMLTTGIFWLPAVAAGAWYAWDFALGLAEEILEPFGEIIADSLGAVMPWIRDAIVAEYMETAIPSMTLLAVLFAVIVTAMFVMVWAGMFIILRRPILVQLQGVTAKATKIVKADKTAKQQRIPKEKPLKEKAERDSKASPELSHIMRHIMRAPAKAGLLMATTLFFVIALGLLGRTVKQAESEVERLYATTIVNTEIVQHPNDPARPRRRLTFDLIPQRNLNEIYALGIVHEAFIEAAHGFAVVLPADTDGSFPHDALNEAILTRDDELFAGGALTQQMVDAFDFLFATNDLNYFTQSPSGFIGRFADTPETHANMEITFANGFDESSFIYAPDQPIPIVISGHTSQNRGVGLGDTVFIAYADYHDYVFYLLDISNYHHGSSTDLPENTPEWLYTNAVVIGIHNSKALFELYRNAVLLPLPALESLLGQTLGYTSFRFGIIPDFNRDLQEVSANLEQAIRFTPHQWFNQLTANIHDEELRHVVEPMEQTLSLFRLLYPIAVILSIVLGAGLSVLLMLQNAKNAAIMTVLGMPKYKSRLMLWAELMIVCIAGAIIGMVVLAVITLSLGASLLLAALPYIAGTIIGAAIGAILITNRAPLDLLQVKE